MFNGTFRVFSINLFLTPPLFRPHHFLIPPLSHPSTFSPLHFLYLCTSLSVCLSYFLAFSVRPSIHPHPPPTFSGKRLLINSHRRRCVRASETQVTLFTCLLHVSRLMSNDESGTALRTRIFYGITFRRRLKSNG